MITYQLDCFGYLKTFTINNIVYDKKDISIRDLALILSSKIK